MSRNQIYLIGTVLSAIALIWTIQYTEASVDYWMTEKESFSDGLNSVTINCKNGGQMDGDFYLVVTFVNASFSESTGQPYYIVDNSTAKFYYTLHPDESRSKIVKFEIDESVDSFSIHLSIEPKSWIMKTNKVHAQNLAYEWTDEIRSYRLIE
jgi:hypothetical protein